MIFKTIADLNNDIVNHIDKINTNIDVVVGIPRSGMLLASIISVYINRPLSDVKSFCNGNIGEAGQTKKKEGWKLTFEEIKHVLVVEDSVNSGKSLQESKRLLQSKFPNIIFIFLAAYVTIESKNLVDIYFEICEQPRVFEWNYMHNSLLNYACVDIDGVLCVDPTDYENDDGERYVNFLKNAKPKMIPTKRIGWIVTSRLEKYRTETESWLKKYNIKYDHLIMMKVGSAEERRILGNHAEFKANVFCHERNSLWFIESDYKQARTISNISGKPVYCVDLQEVYGLNGRKNKRANKKRSLKIVIKHILPDKLVLWLKRK